MQWTAWSIAQNAARPSLPAALAGIVLMSAAVLGGVSGLTGAMADAAAREALQGPQPATLTIRARAGSDVGDQDRRARAALISGFAPATLSISTAIDAEAVPVDGERLLPRHDPTALGLALIVAGRAPSADREAAIQADAAAQLGIEVGQSIDLKGTIVTVTATWRPLDPADPRWAGDPMGLRGADSGVTGPLLVSRRVVESLPGTPLMVWSLIPDLRGAGPDAFGALSAGATQAKDLVGAADDTGRGVIVEGALAERVDAAADDWADARRLGLVPLTTVWAIAVLALVQVGRVVASSRDAETGLLLARGATVARLTVLGAAESVVIAATGAAVGGAAAILGLRAVTGDWAQAPVALAGAVVAALTAVAAFTGADAARARGLGGSPRAERRHSAAAVVGSASGVLLLAATAALATWRLVASGTLPVAEAPLDPDRLAALAPAALLAGAATIAPLALLPVARAVARTQGHASRGIGGWLALGHLARGGVAAGVPLILTVMAVGSATLAGLFGGASRSVGDDLAALERGADVRATLAAPPSAALTLLPDAASLSGVVAASPVWIDTSARLGDSELHLVSGPLGPLASAAAMPAGSPVRLRPDVDLVRGGIPIPEGSRELTVRLTGRMAVDPWQAAMAQQLPELSRRQSDAPWIPDQEEAAAEMTREALANLGSGATVKAELLVRDLHSGASRRLPSGDLTVPGLALSAGDEVVVGPGTEVSAESGVAVPDGGRFVVDGVIVRVPEGPQAATLELAVTMSAGGAPLGPTGEWASDIAIPHTVAGPYRDQLARTPVQVGIAETVSDGGLTSHIATTNRPDVPPLLTPVAGGWRLSAEPAELASVRLGPHVGFSGRDPLGAVERPVTDRVPVSLSAAAAQIAGLAPGDAFEMDAFQRRLAARVASVVDVIPGTTVPHAALADSRLVSAALAATADPMPWPSELWAATADPSAVGSAMAGLPGVEAVVVTASDDEAAGLARNAFWAGAAGGLALAVAGVAAAFVAQLAARRAETRVLLALGLGGRAQGRGRAIEHGVVIVAASVLGVVAGVLAGAWSVPPLVRAAVGADPGWPVPPALDAGPWSLVIAGAALAVGAVLAAVALAVARQARPRAGGRG